MPKKLFKFKDEKKESAGKAPLKPMNPAFSLSNTPGKTVEESKEMKPQKPEEPKKEEKKNLYVDIFSKKKEEKKEETDLMKGVLTKKKKEEDKGKKKILGPMPEFDEKIMYSAEYAPKLPKVLKVGFILFSILALLTFGAQYVELNPDFDLLSSVRGENTGQKLEQMENKIISKQTEINQTNYFLLNYYMQYLSYLSDNYQVYHQDPPSNISQIQNQIVGAFEDAKTKWQEPLVVGNIKKDKFTAEFKKEMQKELAQLKKQTNSELVAQEIEDYTATLSLINNSRLQAFFTKNKVENIQEGLPRDDSALFTLTNDILEFLTTRFSTISTIKIERTPWSVVVAEIDRISKEADPLYNAGFFEELGGLQYASFIIDEDTVRITGVAKRQDGSTFQLITSLMTGLDESTLFKNVENRSYPKSGSLEKGFTSQFTIEIELEDYSQINA